MNETITITGNIATEPEFKRIGNGVPVINFRVASGQRRYDRATNTWVDAGTNWYSVSAFRGLAEHALDSLHKGDRVLVTGRLRLREWDTGTKRGVAVEIDAEAIGHDLLWGTSTFSKSSRSSARSEQEGSTREPSESDSWAAPGIDSAGGASQPVGGTPDSSLVAVGADVSSETRVLAGADSPF
ncbi:single-stranded DNA-binding protein [Microbacterium sp. HD4P20]|uniref:single-stranded DNA-binding protein n=1 Tax=Microbacterium sp. HD4P20 TaxID=2864874 RepID=UPI001C63F13B|nr:single-stranded DNA-binding protein [Microbacterium sp. HD4P20]MCP2636732.1 single-stranded DNA-binding protein [Microbacterium sp. HD4P20]